MSALGHKQTYAVQNGMSALASRADTNRPAKCRLGSKTEVRFDLAPRWTIYEEFEIFPLGRPKRNSESVTLTLKSGAEDQIDDLAPLVGVHPSNYRESTTSHVQFHAHNFLLL